MALEVAGSKLVARPKIFFKRLRLTLGCRQAVRHGILIPAFVGSNPATPAKYKTAVLGMSVWTNSQVRLPPQPNSKQRCWVGVKGLTRRFVCHPSQNTTIMVGGSIKKVFSVARQNFGPLAQLAEHLTFNQGVPGSNLGWTTK